MADIAVGVSLYVLEKVLSFLQQEISLPKKVRNGIGGMTSQLKTLETYLESAEGSERNEGEKDRAKNVRGLAYEIEDALDEFMIQVSMNRHTHYVSRKLHGAKHYFTVQAVFQELSEKINIIEKGIKSLSDLDSLRNAHQGSPMRAENHTATPHIPDEDDVFGFDEIGGTIIDQLISGADQRRQILAIAGPPGSGKSVLVKKACNDKRVLRKFDCHAWVHVTRSFQIDDLLSNLWSQLCPNKPVGMCEGGSNTREKLSQYLGKSRYIVVFDDVWEEQDWFSIVNTLPNGLAGSTIIVTTRRQDVASSCVPSDGRRIHRLNGLTSEVAMDLFCKKAFYASNGRCPQDLEHLSHKIIERCSRLPLLIVKVASLLSKKQHLPSEWKMVYDSLGSEIGTNSNLSVVKNTLLSGYYDLPSHLKSCFLYIGLFPEDYSIARGRLIRLWIAEGFVKEQPGKPLEVVAEDYLNELISRYLITADVIDFDGRPRSCRVGNIVCDFLVTISESNKLSAVLSKSRTSSGVKDYRRLSVQKGYTMDESQYKHLDHTRTFFKFGCESLNFHTFTLLKVVDLEDSGLQNFPEEITELFLLRYLSFEGTNIRSLPESINKLIHLETLNLKHTKVSSLPKEIFKLEKLRHLLVYLYVGNKFLRFNSNIGVEVSAGIGDLRAIQKLSLIKASQHERSFKLFNKQPGSIIEELGNLVHLRKLGIVDLKHEDGEKLCASIEKMESLSTLDVRSTAKEDYLDLRAMNNHRPPPYLKRLYLKGRLLTLPNQIGELKSLVRVGLYWSKLRDSPLDTLQHLSNLIELHLLDAFVGEELIFEAGRFSKLTILRIQQLDGLHTMVVQQGAMPQLKHLTIFNCENLKMLPLGINHVAKLEELILRDMPNEFIARLGTNSEERFMVSHIPVIRSYTFSNSHWSFLNLS